jgi:hypothetical protein
MGRAYIMHERDEKYSKILGRNPEGWRHLGEKGQSDHVNHVSQANMVNMNGPPLWET